MKYIFSFVLLVAIANVQAQEESHSTGAEHAAHTMKGSNRFTLGLGHTHIAEGNVDGKKQWITTASWSVNFDHWLSEKFALGLESDLILETFIIEDSKDEFVERSFPISLVPVAIYKSGKHLALFGGVGAEFSKEVTIVMTRLGLEYGFHIPNNWEIGAALLWDGKWNYYNSWGMSFTISKIWHKR